MLLMLLVSRPEIWTLGQTRLAGVSCRWMPSSVVRPSGRDTGLSHQPRGQQTLVELARQHLAGREVDVGVGAGGLQQTHGLEAV
ncbi:hypothetical protein EYF80_046968 [Liparis tanakae]|uniref:Uncharacterized protein n=1 Tax=Liparis tanakae TaxID=230148 RepID=A0A4Z2FNV3_9TELE|nr:hypothetical protein EYF80_046968 [Liparis tanakae]